MLSKYFAKKLTTNVRLSYDEHTTIVRQIGKDLRRVE